MWDRLTEAIRRSEFKSQKRLCEYLEWHDNAISKWRGGTKIVTLDDLRAVAQAIGTTVGWLVDGDEPAAKSVDETAARAIISRIGWSAALDRLRREPGMQPGRHEFSDGPEPAGKSRGRA